MRPDETRLPPPLAERLADRARALLPLGTVLEDAHAPDAAEREAIDELARRLRATYPYPDPRYAGQMLKPPTALAWAAYATAMLLNPNNHALDGGPATAEMEKDAVEQIAAMFGLPRHLGHLTASGTIANLEALWVARELHPDAAIVSGANAHYTHARVSAVLGARHETIPEDADGRLDLDALAARLARGGVGTVVATPGTTALGAVDDVAAIADLCAEHGARLHVDAAYGGFFALLADGGAPGVTAAPFDAIARRTPSSSTRTSTASSPTAAAASCSRTRPSAASTRTTRPYTYFTSDELHLGEISLECSRAGAAAAALWTTLRALPLTRAGLGRHVAAARAAGLATAAALDADPRTTVLVEPELDIVCVMPAGASAAGASAASVRAFDTLAEDGWHVAKLRVATGGCGDGIRRSRPTRTPSPCCGAACSSRSTRASRGSWRRRSRRTSTRAG